MTDLAHDRPDDIIADALRPDDAPDPDDLVHEVDGVFELAEDVPWQIDGRREAEWAIAKIRGAHERYADATAPAREAIGLLQARIGELSDFIDAEGARRDHTVGFFTGHLTSWLRRLRRKDLADGIAPDKATKSVRLSGGTVQSRAGTDRVQVGDVRALAAWVEEQDDLDVVLVDFVPKVDQRELRAHIRETGEVPPGVRYEPAGEDDRTWSVKIT